MLKLLRAIKEFFRPLTPEERKAAGIITAHEYQQQKNNRRQDNES